jgi:hypothetical protein
MKQHTRDQMMHEQNGNSRQPQVLYVAAALESDL